MSIATKLAILSRDRMKNPEMCYATERLNNMMDIEDFTISQDLFETVFPAKKIVEPAFISINTLDDLQLTEWCKNQANTQGGRNLFHKIVSNPTTSISMLKDRQNMIKRIQPGWQEKVQQLAKIETDLLWIYSLPEKMGDVWPLPLLFPTLPLLNRINKSSRTLHMYHIYRIWLTPLLQIFLPIMSILAPWFYLRYRMGWKLSIVQYFKLAMFLIKQSMEGISAQQKSKQLFMIAMYGFMFIYGIIQTIDVSRMLYAVRNKMMDRVKNIKAFVEGAHSLVSVWDNTGIPCPNIPNGMAGIHDLWLDNGLRENISALIARFYELDVFLTCRRLVDTNGWSFVRYKQAYSSNLEHLCIGMRNPVITGKQTSNPMCLSKNIVITGPNAAGKSTYVRSIGANILMSQTLGICCAKKMVVSPVSAILSYMRVRDIVGTASLFETEVTHCSNIIKAAKEIQNANGSAVVFFDEPMHSTPPLEGQAAAYAVLKYLGELPNIRTIVTSHYHRLTELSSSQWTNISMDAIYDKTSDSYQFPYRIRSGPSFQSIAIELLKGTDKLPSSVVQNAIKFKSAIYKTNNNES